MNKAILRGRGGGRGYILHSEGSRGEGREGDYERSDRVVAVVCIEISRAIISFVYLILLATSFRPRERVK